MFDIKKYVVEVKEQNKSDYNVLSELDNMTTFCKLTGLLPDKDFNVRIKAQNTLGTSDYTDLPDTVKVPKSLGNYHRTDIKLYLI